MFKNLKLGIKLVGGFGAVLFLLACVLVINFFTIRSITTDFKDLMEIDVKIADHAAKLEVLMLQSRRNEKNFLLRKDNEYAKKLENNVAELIGEAQSVVKLAERIDDKKSAQNAKEIIKWIEAYRSDFKAVEKANNDKGFDDKSGLRGKFSETIHVFVEEMEQHEIEDLYIMVLHLLLYEKEYFSKQNDVNKKKLLSIFDMFNKIEKERRDSVVLEAFQDMVPTYKELLEKYSEAGTERDKKKYLRSMREITDEMILFINTAYLPKAKSLILEIRKNEKDYIITGEGAYVESTNKAITDLLNAFKQTNISEEFIEDAETNLDSYKSAFNDIVETDQKISELMTTMQSSVRKIGPLVEKLNIESGKMADLKKKKAAKQAFSRGFIAAVIGISAIALGFILSLLITRQIIGPITKAADFAEIMSKGDLTQQLEIDQNDEIGFLSRALNEMVNNLKIMFVDVSSGVERLFSSSKVLSEISGKMTTGSESTEEKATMVSNASVEMNSNINTVAATMEQATSNIDTIAGATEEMTSTINDISIKSETARGISSKAVVQAENATKRIEELGFAANDIGKVTEAITEISEQTNLLALNATIESARAGEAGKGFAVVAGEIKDLAQQTAVATKEIKEKVRGIQDSAEYTVVEIKQIAEIINNINDIVSAIDTSVSEQSRTTSDISGNIGQTSQKIREINENMSHNSKVVGEITDDIAEVTVAASEMSNSSSQVNISAEELSELAETLKKMVGKFKI